jgi:hypothetical protein
MGWTKRGVERIKKLTPKQEAEILAFSEKWNNIARSTEPCDGDRVVEGMKRFFEAMGCRKPKRGFYKTKSPSAGAKKAGYLYNDEKDPNFHSLGVCRRKF